nr:MAG TPA: hypothetical protein [Caudoviricetes sp.]
MGFFYSGMRKRELLHPFLIRPLAIMFLSNVS